MLENFITLPQGGATRRPGTKYVAPVKTASAFTRLIPFIYSTTQAYMLEFGNEYMRVFMDGGQVMDGASPYEISTPYSTADLPEIKYAQSADTLYLVHPDYEPRELTRSGHTSWTLSTLGWENGPYMKENDTDVTLTLASVAGSTGRVGQSVDVTASSATFSSADVGRWIKIRYNQESSKISSGKINPTGAEVIGGPWSVDGAWTITGNFYSSDLAHHRVAIEYSIDGGSTWQEYDAFLNIHGTTRVTIEGELRSEDYNDVIPKIRLYADGDINEFRWVLRYARESVNGMLKITSYTSTTEVRCEVMKKCEFIGTPTKRWSLGVWGSGAGWPATVTFHQGRLVFGGNPTYPSRVWMSVTDDYTNFDSGVGDEDDDAIDLMPMASEVNNVMWMASKGNLIVGTAGDEWVFDASNITPTNPPNLRRETNFGSANGQAVIANGFVVFIQYGDQIIRQIQYDWESDTYLAIDLTAMSDHITGDGVHYLAYLKSPWSTLWTCRDDGQLVGLTYMPEHKVYAWHRHMTATLAGDSEVESVACIPGSVWMVVKREIDGSTVRYIEYLEKWDETLDNSVFMDCAAEYDGSATATISGLSYLEGETVEVIADGKHAGQKTVADGSITLDTSATHVWVGLPYTSTLQTINVEHATPPETLQGSLRRVVHAVARLVNTVGGKIGFDTEDAYDIEYRQEGSPKVTSPELFTGDIPPVNVKASSGRPLYLTVVQDEPYPMTVTSVIVRMEVQG